MRATKLIDWVKDSPVSFSFTDGSVFMHLSQGAHDWELTIQNLNNRSEGRRLRGTEDELRGLAVTWYEDRLNGREVSPLKRSFHVDQSIIDEVAAVSAANNRRAVEEATQARRADFIGDPDIALHNSLGEQVVIGHLADLPQWAQAYIRQLRSDLFDKENK